MFVIIHGIDEYPFQNWYFTVVVEVIDSVFHSITMFLVEEGYDDQKFHMKS